MAKFSNKQGGEYEFDILVPEKNSGGSATYDASIGVVSTLQTGMSI